MSLFSMREIIRRNDRDPARALETKGSLSVDGDLFDGARTGTVSLRETLLSLPIPYGEPGSVMCTVAARETSARGILAFSRPRYEIEWTAPASWDIGPSRAVLLRFGHRNPGGRYSSRYRVRITVAMLHSPEVVLYTDEYPAPADDKVRIRSVVLSMDGNSLAVYVDVLCERFLVGVARWFKGGSWNPPDYGARNASFVVTRTT